jgi:hypothetical protein
MRFPFLMALALGACASLPTSPVPEAWTRVDEAPKITTVAWRDGAFRGDLSDLRGGPTAIRVVRAGGGEKIVNGDKDVTPIYPAIDSFDYSDERHEVIFSAKREKGYDIGLAADDGSEIHWLPDDPADELGVRWAPKGNKVSYLVRGSVGTLIRTLHIPTSTQLTVDFPWASIRSFAYEPTGQRYAVVYSTPDASERIESLKYGGEERRLEVAPSRKLDVTVDRRGDALLLIPNAIRYGEKLPLVVWMSSDPLAWSDARASLMRNARVACAVVTREPEWSSFREIPWVDSSRLYLVGDASAPSPVTVIHPSAGLNGRFERRANLVTVPAGIVESFAAGFIADQLKGTSPPDGHHHR